VSARLDERRASPGERTWRQIDSLPPLGPLPSPCLSQGEREKAGQRLVQLSCVMRQAPFSRFSFMVFVPLSLWAPAV
jgi:hypothetical protein